MSCMVGPCLRVSQNPCHEAAQARQLLKSHLDESQQLNGNLMDQVTAQAQECGKFKADNKSLVKDFTETIEDYGILETWLAHARQEAQQLRVALATVKPGGPPKTAHAQAAPAAPGNSTSASGSWAHNNKALHEYLFGKHPAPVHDAG
ncbi:hypothetical protein BDV93DRAFT_514446 [Ceratobasidium sp. AG-I]|nr:hypothetical protein BDV93DRAFT_514446 [Ceratobasidium sp. AG-I]